MKIEAKVTKGQVEKHAVFGYTHCRWNLLFFSSVVTDDVIHTKFTLHENASLSVAAVENVPQRATSEGKPAPCMCDSAVISGRTFGTLSGGSGGEIPTDKAPHGPDKLGGCIIRFVFLSSHSPPTRSPTLKSDAHTHTLARKRFHSLSLVLAALLTLPPIVAQTIAPPPPIVPSF